MQAITVGRLVVDPTGGLGLQAPDGRLIHLRWPNGWTARADAGAIALADPSGTIVAHVGDTVSVGGGGSGDTFDVCLPVTVVAPSRT